MSHRLTGRVIRFSKSAGTSAGRPEKRFYIISSFERPGDFSAFWSSLVPDALGQRHCPVGTVVTFIATDRNARRAFHLGGKDASKPNRTRLNAVDVKKVHSSLDEIDLSTWREIGIVESMSGRLGVLIRANGIDLIDFRPTSLGPDLQYSVKKGDRLEFSVVRQEVITDTGDTIIHIYATNLCLAPSKEARELFYAPGSIEEYFLKASQQSLE
jgi:hypothetical protein